MDAHSNFHSLFSCILQVIANKAKRDLIVALKTAGATNKKIVTKLKVCLKNVYNGWKWFQQLGSTSAKAILGRTPSACS